MPVITSITPNSPAAKRNIAAGDILLSINGQAIEDILDYRFYAAERKCKLVFERNGNAHKVTVRKDEYEDLGLEFEDGLMDEQHACRNNCIFCFIDQLPPGLRAPLYFKDDDARLGFLFGNYITLTNLTEREVARIIEMKLSPVNISVHTMNPALRREMMGNAQAGGNLRYLAQFVQAGLELNIQLVLCPGINDGEELRFSLEELRKLPTVQSIAAVPVGLTKYREGLAPLRPFTKAEARAVIDIFDEFEGECCASDEFFLLAEQEIPSIEYYGDFRQLENGVGLWALLKDEILDLLQALPTHPASSPACTIVTGYAAYPLLQFFIDELRKTWHNKRAYSSFDINVRRVENRFFGENITVAGLLTGRDVIEQLRDEGLGQMLILPAVMFNHDGLTLDGLTLEEISRELNLPVYIVENNAQALLDIIGELS